MMPAWMKGPKHVNVRYIMLTRIAKFLGYVKYVSVIGYGSEWVRFDALTQEIVSIEGVEVLDGKIICWDAIGTYDGYYIVG